MRWLHFLFDFRGRFNRKTFGLLILGYVLYIALAFSILEFLGSQSLPWVLAVWFPGALAVVMGTIKRLHDRNRRGWWLLFFAGVPFALGELGGTLIFAWHNVDISESIFHLAMYALVIIANIPLWWGFVEIGFLRGTAGDNRFGPDPLADKT